jgi:hypothetical protein
MSIQEMLQEARTLSLQERKELMKGLVDLLTELDPAPAPRKRSLREFRGLGAHLYNGVDAQAYLDRTRNEWDERV